MYKDIKFDNYIPHFFLFLTHIYEDTQKEQKKSVSNLRHFSVCHFPTTLLTYNINYVTLT
jgi:hypothetical protein